MKDKRTYNKLKEHGEDMTHENEVKTTKKPESSVITALTEQFKTENQLKATKQIVIEMSSTIRQLHTENENFQAEIARLREEIQLLEMQIKK